ncbi:flagellin [Saccharospirillum alexandrii]|uniref:flagellin N-terminal helical domain-containing protein n=1 Tax=Saccharospirillum alexandrii TaxID=2448477 RepID=UPI000FDCDBAC|nr:flagellin [Saccharospirillum alexandrii]
MPQIINTNIASLNAQRNLNSSQSANSTALERLSSGLRINSAKDDAAGLAISTKFESQTRGLNQAIRNAGDGISLAQTAEGALGSMTDNLQRVRELAVQSANATNSDEDRVALQQEVSALVAEITRTADETNFNGRNLFDGNFNGTFQIGANAGQTVDVQIGELTAGRLGASDQVGVSAIGSDRAISNGDLTLNGVSITASQAGDDTASFANAGASAIAKAAAINKFSDQTGVEAFANENLAAGSSMTGTAGSGSFTLNGVSIDFTTSTDTASTRASVAQAINAVSEQTGVIAVSGETDADGIQLVAEDGRNITLSIDTDDLTTLDETTFNQATGLMGGLTEDPNDATVFSNTVEGGYTLVARGDTQQIQIDGGDGTGLGNLENAGLKAGTFGRGTAAIVSSETTGDTSGTALGLGGTLTNTVGTATAPITAALTLAVEQDGVTYAAATTAGDTLSDISTQLNAAGANIQAWEQIDATLDLTAATAADTITVGGVAIALEAGDDNAALVDKLNAADFSAADIEISASLDSDGNISASIRNYSADEVTFASSAATSELDVTVDGTTVTADGTDTAFLAGDIRFVSTDGKEATVTVTDSSATAAEVFTGANESVTVSGGVQKGLGAGDLAINGVSIGAAIESADTASATTSSTGATIVSSDKSKSAIAISAAINAVSDATGVTAETNATEVTGGDGSNVNGDRYAVGDSAELFINGISLGILSLQDDGTGNVDLDKAKADTVEAINAASGKTGVTAVDNGVSLTLTAADGRNISVAIDNNTVGAEDVSDDTQKGPNIGALFGLDSAVDGIGEARFDEMQASRGLTAEADAEAFVYETTYGTVSLESASEISIEAGTNGASAVEDLGLRLGSYGGGEDGQFLKDVDISTFEGAQAAITAIDNALQTVASQRAELGALQNRFESTVSNLAITAENLTAANSRIRDADFAAETAELSRTQVLQQAGISILAQANQRPQQVLSLLG